MYEDSPFQLSPYGSSLKEIFSTGALVYLDTSSIHPPGQGLLSIFFQDGKITIAGINYNSLIKHLNSLKEFESFLNYDCSLVIPEVASEISKLKNIFVKSYSRVMSNGSRGHTEKRRALKSIKMSLENIVERTKSISVHIEDEHYFYLTDMINLISNNLKISGLCSGGKDTDERVVAAAYYDSIYEQIPVNVISNDRDFGRIFLNTHLILSLESFAPFNTIFNISMRKFPIRLYSRGKLGFNIIYSSKGKIKPFKELIDYYETKEFLEMKEELMKKFRFIHDLSKIKNEGDGAYNKTIN
ncbi:MAG: hypothetical protein QW727_03470 [Candidatus Pacearchaeota archaeon]